MTEITLGRHSMYICTVWQLSGSSWNCQNLAAEQPLAGQAVRTAHHSTNHTAELRSSSWTGRRVGPALYGLRPRCPPPLHTLPRWAERSTLPPHYVFLPPFCLMDAKSCPHRLGCPLHRVHTEWQLPLSGVHTILMEKLARPGEGGECTPTFFHYIYQHVQSCGVRSSWEGRSDTLPLFILYPYMYSMVHCKHLICLHSQFWHN